jgi:hypothetical protein
MAISSIRASLMTVALASLLAPPALAQPADLTPEAMGAHLAQVGSWDFAARKKGPDGRPECTEVWHFDADGTGWVQSGEQRVTLSWRTEQDSSDDRWLRMTPLASTTGADCMGRPSNPANYPEAEYGFVVMFNNMGNALTCRPASYIMVDGVITDERILRDEDCWGSLTPAKTG